ncbi:MAG: hypothetical protein FWD75_07990 [Propionibacteriaceae bacterium]|nr:hypothetical protein [Propionibacteriaceae bacterium]
MAEAPNLDGLPGAFRYTEAVESIGERRLRTLIDQGAIRPLARGLYRKGDWLGDEDLAEIAVKSRQATICLRSALARHDLIDDIPAVIDIAIPRGSWQPAIQPPVRWHHFDAATFDLGRQTVDIGTGHAIGLYSPERSIVDASRLRHREGPDMAIEALKRWLRSGGQPSTLLKFAQVFPRTLSFLRSALEVLL